MNFEFEGPVVEWRGPAPYYFIAIPEEDSEDIKYAAKGVEYWGQVPVTVCISAIEFTTALFPKGGRYLLPVKADVRKSAGIEVDTVLAVALRVGRQEDGVQPPSPAEHWRTTRPALRDSSRIRSLAGGSDVGQAGDLEAG